MNLKSQCGWNYFLEKGSSSFFQIFDNRSFWWADFTALLPLFTAQILYLDLINQLKLSKWHKLWLQVLGISFLCLIKTTRRRLLRILISPQHTICSISWLFSSKSWYFKVYSISHGRTKSSIGSFGRHVLIDVLNWKNRIIPSKYYSYH